MDYGQDEFYEEELDDEEDLFAANPLSTHSRGSLSAGGEGPASYDDDEDDDGHYDAGEENGDRGGGQGDFGSRFREPSMYAAGSAAHKASPPLPVPARPLAGSLEEQARLAVSALIRGAVGDGYDEQAGGLDTHCPASNDRNTHIKNASSAEPRTLRVTLAGSGGGGQRKRRRKQRLRPACAVGVFIGALPRRRRLDRVHGRVRRREGEDYERRRRSRPQADGQGRRFQFARHSLVSN